jgi:hypothetical protein
MDSGGIDMCVLALYRSLPYLPEMALRRALDETAALCTEMEELPLNGFMTNVLSEPMSLIFLIRGPSFSQERMTYLLEQSKVIYESKDA